MWGLGAFIGWFQHNVLGNMPSQFHGMLDQAGQIVEHEAQRVLGTYEYNWTPLAAETVARKATGDSPGLETGEMRDSVYHTVTYANGGGGEVAVGSNLDKAVWFELGTSRGIPPGRGSRRPPKTWRRLSLTSQARKCMLSFKTALSTVSSAMPSTRRRGKACPGRPRGKIAISYFLNLKPARSFAALISLSMQILIHFARRKPRPLGRGGIRALSY